MEYLHKCSKIQSQPSMSLLAMERRSCDSLQNSIWERIPTVHLYFLGKTHFVHEQKIIAHFSGV